MQLKTSAGASIGFSIGVTVNNLYLSLTSLRSSYSGLTVVAQTTTPQVCHLKSRIFHELVSGASSVEELTSLEVVSEVEEVSVVEDRTEFLDAADNEEAVPEAPSYNWFCVVSQSTKTKRKIQ